MNALCSFCAKTTFYPHLIDDLVVIKVYVLTFGIPCALLMLIAYAAIFVKQMHLESQSNVHVEGNIRVVSRGRHQRTVISAIGHFTSFIVSCSETTLLYLALYFFPVTEETLFMFQNLITFFFPSMNFVFYPLIETLCSQNLRDTLLQWS